MALLPIFAELSGRPCLVVGGGEVAWRKSVQLLEAGARLTVNAPAVDPRLRELSRSHSLDIVEADYRPELVAQAMLVVAATSDARVNAAVAAAAEKHNVLCNVVDDLAHCSFILPAIVQRGDVTVAISTAGSAPVLARRIKGEIEEMLPARIDALADFARRWRPQVKAALDTMTARRRLWEEVFDGEIAGHVLAGREAQANRAMTERLAAGNNAAARKGQAWLVGAGPGDAGLITVRGKHLLARADVVLYDRLVAPQLLRFARREADLVFVGKRAGESSVQARINEMLVRHVTAGKRVCRLKGGDPFLFGRGGEEIEALEAAGLDYEIVPGVTAALGCAAYAGIPLTHRSDAHSLWLGTGHEAPDHDETDWTALARSHQTLALYMSVGRLQHITERLQAHGRAADTPCAIVENGARPEQRVLRTTLAALAGDAQRYGVTSPAMLFIGEAAARAGLHAWFAPEGFIDCRSRDDVARLATR